MHIIAYSYHWDRSTLWDMSRSERRMWVKMVQMQKNAENEAINKGNKRYTPSTYKESS